MARGLIKYKPELAEKLPEMFANGEDVAEVATKLGISRQTFYQWVEKFPKFAEAYALGKQYSEAWWSKLGRAGAAGKVDIQATVWIFNMKNKFGWRDRTETTMTGEITVNEVVRRIVD
jgi:hypothetical protein